MPNLPYTQKQITEIKQEILLLLQQYSFTHPLVISRSQELDRLIYLYMRQNPTLPFCTCMGAPNKEAESFIKFRKQNETIPSS
ncbi:aspartyl-phosphate phosphatase Spo0E family protein [Bacillus bombysepticus]|uniref:aspartyl-phosphate phosphatase Spo0E family protein n=1 Tax=Bacillus bombysepticus TaxID=658666 RepID=UPI00301A503E